MSASSIDRLSDQLGTLTPSTPDEKARDLIAALKATTSADEAVRFRAMLGLTT